MSAKTRNALKIAEDVCDKFSSDYARVIVLDESQKQTRAKVLCFVSMGECAVDDPLCVARFNLTRSETVHTACTVGEPEMFSHLDDAGTIAYQPFVADTTVDWCGTSAANVPLEYGPNFILRNTPVDTNFKPGPLLTQGEHTDGNFYSAKNQWVEHAPGKFHLSPDHTPFKTESDMQDAAKMDPVFLHGTPAENSTSYLMGVNAKTTLSFPAQSTSHVAACYAAPVPFGGFNAFSFVEDHMGSSYLMDPNERLHLYAHCNDLRQFPVMGAGQLMAILAAKQRLEHLRLSRTSANCTPALCTRAYTHSQLHSFQPRRIGNCAWAFHFGSSGNFNDEGGISKGNA